MQSENQYVHLPILVEKNITLAIKREDLLHPFISGNKYRKLKYNVLEAIHKKHTTLLTFGGAFSNHIAALSVAGKEKGLRTIGVIRGEELAQKWQTNPTLSLAHENGMRFKFVNRESYRTKTNPEFLDKLRQEFGQFYLVPEGGTNELAVKGCEEILDPIDIEFDKICVSTGTGGTITGLINASEDTQEVLGFSALKGDFLKSDIASMTAKRNWKLICDYHFGGYAKISEELVLFINWFKKETGIPLDPVYTGKMVFGLLKMIENDSFAMGTKVLAVHTGGLQGLVGMNMVLKKKNLPLLDI
ncbi:1-aminocyclopropane-1-carboxylate deaminase/D-cysteine desulfhydrase [Maribacter sp. CXY002]|uniref:1-aminocyclopropane-1-carboxylate deaminase/D-cysteine desulfhydrase n=1 Tax=Maribacter luteocoastalis TaxID=3407671 RepID=UPI003B66BCEB